MFRLWAKEFKDNRMLRDTVIEDGSSDTRTHKVFHALDEVCYRFDLCLMLRSGISSAMIKPDSHRIILSNPLILIIWKFMSLKKTDRFYTFSANWHICQIIPKIAVKIMHNMIDTAYFK